ncbi:MAG: hypothetical protein A2X94_15235 [Bdellovibrionales bacterium GWB1_55_8]|nr:MAG: hypothetical protein A2X94_15235 [Bdellovibrionales bacterium GWB1_55_8]
MRGLNRFGKKIALALVVIALGTAVLLGGTSFYVMRDLSHESVATLRKTLFSDFDKSARFQVEAAISILEKLHQRQLAGELSLEEAKRRGAETLRSMAYGADGYLWVDSFEGINIVNQGKDSEGSSRWDAKDQKGNLFIQKLIQAGKKDGGGYFEYWFPKPGQEKPLPKRSYTLAFEPFQWVVGTGNYVDDLEALIAVEEANTRAKLRNGMVATILIVAIAIAIALFIALQIGRGIAAPLELAIAKLQEQANQTMDSSHSIAAASQQLAQSTNEQAAAMQETSASVEEMNAMIQKNAENASSSGSSARASVESARKGKGASEQMLQAIQDIERSNLDIMTQIDESNQSLTEITKVIAGITSKTKVIHDIVFQTKLLSFNASVEAARAGEAGKGFAVVAEEVGKLAQMSGTAAKEIGDMLNESSQKVEQIIQGTKSKVEALVSRGRISVEQGTRMAAAGTQVLDEILVKVAQVDSMISEITVASQEQAQGVSEITKAMGQLDQTTHHNNDVSQSIASTAEGLSGQAAALGTVVAELRAMVRGADQVSGEAEESSEANPAHRHPMKRQLRVA